MKLLARLSIATLWLFVPTIVRSEAPPVFVRQFDTSSLSNIGGLGVDAEGNVLVADGGNNRIVKFSRLGVPIGAFGTTGSGPGQFKVPSDIVVSPIGEIYVSDAQNSRIQVFDSQFTYLRQWAPGSFPTLAIDPTGQFLFALSGGLMEVFHPDGSLVATWPCMFCDNGGINGLRGYGFGVGPSGRVYWGFRGEVHVFDHNGNELNHWSVGPTFPQDNAVAVDNAENIYVTTADATVRKYTSAGILLSTFGGPGVGPGQFGGGPMPEAAVDSQGTIFVEDLGSNRIQEFADPTTATLKASWGELKQRFRMR